MISMYIIVLLDIPQMLNPYIAASGVSYIYLSII